MTSPPDDQPDWLQQHLRAANDVLWSHAPQGYVEKPVFALNPAVKSSLYWLWVMGVLVMTILNFRHGQSLDSPPDLWAVLKICLWGVIILLSGFVFLRVIYPRLAGIDNRQAFQYGVIKKSGVFLWSQSNHEAELAYEDIKSVGRDYEQGAQAMKIQTYDGASDYILFGLADFDEAIRIIESRLKPNVSSG